MPRRVVRELGEVVVNGDPADQRDPDVLLGQVRSLLAEAQALSARLAALNEVAVAMQSRTATDEMLEVMARQARWLLDFQCCLAVLHEPGGLRVLPLRGPRLPPEQLLWGAHRRAVEAAADCGYALLIESLADGDGAPPEMRSALIMPLRAGDQRIGTLNFYSRTPRQYTRNDLRIATALAVQVAAILQNARLLTAVTRTRDELHTILESIGDGVLVLDQRGRVVLINRALDALLGHPAESLAGRRALHVARLRSGGRRLLASAGLRELWQQVRLAEGGAPTLRHGSGVLRLSDGRHIEWAVAPLADDGAMVGYVVTLRDVSARAELEQLREDMTQMLVHDLRSPLTSVMMGLDMLEIFSAAGDAAEQKITLDHVRNAARRLLDQVNTLLDVSKLEAGRLELDRELTTVQWLLDTALSPLLPLVQQNEQRIAFDIADDLPLLRMDTRLTQRVIQNLLDNAIKFSPHGGLITLGARLTGERHVRLSVQDSGPGIPPDQRERIFEKFSQVRATDTRRGTGLGLSFVSLVAAAHGGRVAVEDGPGGGSVFWLEIPLDQPAPEASAPARVATAAGPGVVAAL